MLFDSGKKKKERALELLDMVGLNHRKDHRLDQMSGGEQQRVAIAIALANDPKILLADEPTGSVDAKTGAYILDVLRNINETTGVTTVIVTHDRQLTKKVNRVVSIRDGKLSSERVMKQSYRDRLSEISAFTEESEVQDEFAVLDRAGRLQIPKEYLEQLQQRMAKVGVQLNLPEELAQFLGNQSRAEEGARHLRHLVQEQVEGPLAEHLLRSSRKSQKVQAALKDGRVVFHS